MKRILWLIYVLLIGYAVVTGLFLEHSLLNRGGFSLVLYTTGILFIIFFGLVGVFGHIFQKKFFSRFFWQHFLFIFIIGGFLAQVWYDLFYISLTTPSVRSTLIEIVSIPFQWWIILPYLYAIYMYAFRSPEIWEN